MTGLSISARADDWANQFQAALDSLPAYSPHRSRTSLSVQSGITLARMLADLARVVEANHAGVLLEHQGPFFNGTDERCGCGHPVKSAEEWAAHVNQKLEDGA